MVSQTSAQNVLGYALDTDIVNNAVQQQAITVSTTAVQALGGATILANRKLLTITPTNGVVFWGISSGVTTATGFPIATNQNVSLSFGANISVFLIAAASTTCIVLEGS